MADKLLAHDAPMSGAVLVGTGMPAVIRIPIPGANGLCFELRPRGFVPKGGSTSTVFFQDMAGKRNLRLDYGYNVKTQTMDFHWNQKGTFDTFQIADHTPVGKVGEVLYSGAKYFRYAGRVFLVAGAALDIYSIAVASNPLRRTAQVVSGWAGAWAGAEAGGISLGAAGSLAGPEGTAIGAILGGIGGGIGGYFGGSRVGSYMYDWAQGTVFTPVPQTAKP